MTWDRAGLAKQGFYYDENIRSKTAAEAAYPPHVVALRASMLDFFCPVLGCKHECDESGNLQLDPESIEWHSPHLDTGLSVANRTQNDAHHLNRGGFAEIVWNEFFHNHFFKPLLDSTSMCKANSRRYAQCMIDGVRSFTPTLLTSIKEFRAATITTIHSRSTHAIRFDSIRFVLTYQVC